MAAVTRELMSRAANDLADVIRTIPTGAGLAPAPAAATMRINHIHPAQNHERRRVRTLR